MYDTDLIAVSAGSSNSRSSNSSHGPEYATNVKADLQLTPAGLIISAGFVRMDAAARRGPRGEYRFLLDRGMQPHWS
jgi:hypothetical protein